MSEYKKIPHSIFKKKSLNLTGDVTMDEAIKNEEVYEVNLKAFVEQLDEIMAFYGVIGVNVKRKK